MGLAKDLATYSVKTLQISYVGLVAVAVAVAEPPKFGYDWGK